jgi:hypothetical protein
MARVPLNETAIIQLNGSGAGTAKLGPQSARETWYPDNVHVSVNTAVLESTCTIFKGMDATQPNFRDESVLGSTGDASGAVSGDVLKTGQYVWAVWTGGDANAKATLTVTGQRNV